jgi:hypothetical protein
MMAASDAWQRRGLFERRIRTTPAALVVRSIVVLRLCLKNRGRLETDSISNGFDR